MGSLALLFLLLTGTAAADPWEHVAVDNHSSYPALGKLDSTYVLVYSKRVEEGRNLFLRYSKDGLNWSLERRLTRFMGTDYQPSLLVDRRGSCWLAFTRKSPEKQDYDVFLTTSQDCHNWTEPVPFVQTHTNDWYPYLYQDSAGTYWLLLSRNVVDDRGRVNSAIFYTRSKDGVQWEELNQVTRALGAVFPRMVEHRGYYLLFFSAFTGNWENLSRINEHNLFVMRSEDGIRWSKGAQISRIPAGKYVLYLDADTDEEGRVWVAYTSNEGINEEVYLFSSRDGVSWSLPERVTRNAEYIASLREPYGFKCDQKSLLIDGKKFIIAYSCAISPDEAPMFVAVGTPQYEDTTYIVANFSIDMRPAKDEFSGEPRDTSGYVAAILAAALVAVLVLLYHRRR